MKSRARLRFDLNGMASERPRVGAWKGFARMDFN
jgi:hypothetical protein